MPTPTRISSSTFCATRCPSPTPIHIPQRLLSSYCAALLSRLPKTASGATSVSPPLVGSEWHIKLPDEEERVVAHVMHTAEFCSETAEALAGAVLKDIKPALAEQVRG